MWDLNGHLICESEYRNNKLNGLQKKWDQEGHIIEEVYY